MNKKEKQRMADYIKKCLNEAQDEAAKLKEGNRYPFLTGYYEGTLKFVCELLGFPIEQSK